jgi:precorrin-6B methylase 2
MWSCPAEIEVALWSAVRGQLGDDIVRERVLCPAIIARSSLYTDARDDLAQVRGSADLAARALFFTVADVAKVMLPVTELSDRGLLPDRALRVVDVGAGVGAMSLGLLACLPGHKLVIDAIDRDRAALRLFSAAVAALPESWNSRVGLACAPGDVAGWQPDGTYDLALLGSVVNELDASTAQALVSRVLAHLADDGAVIIIEPALRATSRALHQLRDWLIESDMASVFAPCVRRGAPCPALADADDWCHEDRPTSLPRQAARLANATGLRRHGAKFAYLVLRRDGQGRLSDGEGVRVVSKVRKLKGRREGFVCGESGRYPLRLLKRNLSPLNRAFEHARRGDIVLTKEGGGDITREQRVELDHLDGPRAPGDSKR